VNPDGRKRGCNKFQMGLQRVTRSKIIRLQACQLEAVFSPLRMEDIGSPGLSRHCELTLVLGC
jgi:hypothetical protein